MWDQVVQIREWGLKRTKGSYDYLIIKMLLQKNAVLSYNEEESKDQTGPATVT